MIIHSLEFYNFLPFHAKQLMQFDVKRCQDRPFTLIVAPTNSGKTTTIRALRFLLYNEINASETISVHHKLINHRAKLECQNGKSVQSWVKADITWGKDERITFRRRIEASRHGSGIDDFHDSLKGELEVQVLDENKGHDYEARSAFQRSIDLFAPRLLFNSFFFAGEPGEGHIDPTRVGTGLAREIEELFRLGAWKEARQALHSVQQGLSAVATNADRTQREVDEAFKLKEKALGLLNSCNDKILELGKLNEQEEIRRYELERKLQDHRPKGEAAQKYEAEADRFEQSRKDYEARELAARRQVEALAAGDCGSSFILGGLKTVEGQIAKLRDNDLLPADVSPDFINKLLYKTQKCICDRPLDHDHEDARRAIELHLSLSLASQTSTDLQALAENLVPVGSSGRFQWEEQILNQAQQVRTLTDEMHDSALKAADAERSEKQCRSKVNEADKDEARKLEKELNQSRAKIKSDTTQIGFLMRDLSTLESSYKKKVKDYQEAKLRLPKNERSATQRREAKSSMIQSALALLEETERALRQSLRSQLQDRIKESYDRAAMDGSIARIEPDLCPRIYRNGAVITALGGGQKLMLQLAFVVALADLYNEIRNLFSQLKLVLRNSTHISIFADAPFAHTAQEYNKAIVEFLAKCPSPQVVLLMHKQQWLAVEAHLRGKVKEAFGYRLHSSKPGETDEYVFNFNGQTTELLKVLVPGEESFSEVVSINIS